MHTTFIYCLCEPGTKEIRYFGKADNPRHRYRRHLCIAKSNLNNYHTNSWISELQKSGKSPEMHVLCEVPLKEFARLERAFIALGRKYGMALTNVSAGGGPGAKKIPDA